MRGGGAKVPLPSPVTGRTGVIHRGYGPECIACGLSGQQALRGTSHAARYRAPNLASDLLFIMFHAFRRPDREAERMIAMAASSVRRHHACARVVLLTNLDRIDEVQPWVEIRAFPIDLDRMMFERSRIYADVVDTLDEGSVAVFMDTDMLLMRSLDPYLDDAADLTLTFRPTRHGAARPDDFMTIMPINGGLYIANLRNGEPVRRFFRDILKVYSAMPADQMAWWGDQLALVETLKPPVFSDRSTRIAVAGALTVRYVHVKRLNQTPKSWMLRLGLFNPVGRLLHFKGPRKRWMRRYFRLYVSPFLH